MGAGPPKCYTKPHQDPAELCPESQHWACVQGLSAGPTEPAPSTRSSFRSSFRGAHRDSPAPSSPGPSNWQTGRMLGAPPTRNELGVAQASRSRGVYEWIIVNDVMSSLSQLDSVSDQPLAKQNPEVAESVFDWRREKPVGFLAAGT